MREPNNQFNSASTQLIQAEKLASIGQLSAGIAHEINNPLGFIDSNLSTLGEYIQHLTKLLHSLQEFKTAMENDDPKSAAAIKEQIAEVESQQDTEFILGDIENLIGESKEGVDRIKKIVSSFKMFSKVNDEQKVLYDLKDILENVFSLTENETKYKAEIKKSYGEIPQIECYPQQLGHVFINIILNAVDAIAKEGLISVTTGVKKAVLGDPGVGRREVDSFREGDELVVITVEDDGKGIAKDNLAKVFDPFFTTKDVNQGPGLGLTLSFEIIKKHNGFIDIESKEGKGTKVSIILPVKIGKSDE